MQRRKVTASDEAWNTSLIDHAEMLCAPQATGQAAAGIGKGGWSMQGPARRHRKERCAPENFSGEVNYGFPPDFVGTDSTAC